MSRITVTESVCARIAQHLAKSVGERRYHMWFDRTARFDYQHDRRRLEVLVPNSFVADWIGRHFKEDLHRAARHELGEAVDLQVQIKPDAFTREDLEAADDTPPGRAGGGSGRAHGGAVEPAQGRGEASKGAGQGAGLLRWPGLSATGRPPRDRQQAVWHTLEGFVAGSSNELAYAAAKRLAEDENPATNPLYIYGGCGLGKTHLLQGICRRVTELRPQARVEYTTGEQFTNEFLAAVRSGRVEQFRKRIRRLDLLVVDDVQFLANKQATQQEFLHTFDVIGLSGARVVLASQHHPKQIEQFSEALVSRCMRGMVVEVRTPDTETRVRIIRELARRRGLSLLDSAVDVLASRCVGSVREIEGALTKLQALVNLTDTARAATQGHGHEHPAIGRAVVDRLFNGDLSTNRARVVRFENVVAAVVDHLGVERSDVLGTKRNSGIVLARSLTVYLARQMTPMSYPEIAAAMGRRNHSTVVTASHRMEQQLAENRAVSLPGSKERVPLLELAERIKAAVARG